jgi:hypothetical protein
VHKFVTKRVIRQGMTRDSHDTSSFRGDREICDTVSAFPKWNHFRIRHGGNERLVTLRVSMATRILQ